MMVHLQQPVEKRTQAKYFPLFICIPDVSGITWSRNRIFTILENYALLPVNISFYLNYFILFGTLFGNLAEASEYH